MKLTIEIDNKAGFCFGVVNAINAVEKGLSEHDPFYCLGHIVHNEEEIIRLNNKGLQVADKNELESIQNSTVLIRAHGEPPGVYIQLAKNRNMIVDATCPIVLKLQQRVKKSHQEVAPKNGVVVIYGKKGHPEVVGLLGQTDNKAIVVSGLEDLNLIDFTKPIRLYSQTTKSREGFREISGAIERQMKIEQSVEDVDFESYDTICGQVANRVPHLKEFAPQFDVFVFVSGKNSSNGKYLYSIVQEANPNSFVITSKEEIDPNWFCGMKSVGISGATSTPAWLLEEIASSIASL